MRELELEPGRSFKMITLASKSPLFGKSGLKQIVQLKTKSNYFSVGLIQKNFVLLISL